LILLAFIVIPMTIAGSLGFVISKRSLERSRVQGLESTAELKVQKIDDFFRERRGNLATIQKDATLLQNLPILAQYYGDPANPEYLKARALLDRRLDPISQSYQYNDILLTNPDGKIVYASNKTHFLHHLGRLLPGPGNASFLNAKNSVYLSDIFSNELEPGHFFMLLSGPINDEAGNFQGVLALGLNMDQLYILLKNNTGLGQTGETLLAKRVEDGALFLNPLRYDPDAALRKKALFGGNQVSPIQKAVQGQNGSGISVDYRGVQVLAAWRYIPDLDWGLEAKIDASEAFSAAHTLLKAYLVLSALVLLLGLLAASLTAKSLYNRIAILQKGAESIGSGDLDFRFGAKSQDEMGALSRSLDRMTAKLKSLTASRDELEKKVALASRDELGKEVAGREQAEGALGESEERFRANTVSRDKQDKDLATVTRDELGKEVAGRSLAEDALSESEERFRANTVSRDKQDKDLATASRRELRKEASGRKLAEDALGESEERFRVIFEKATVGKLLTAPDGKLLEVNPAFADMLGYTIEEVQQLNFDTITHPDDITESRECVRSLLANERSDCRVEKRYLHKSGRPIWTDESTTLLRDSQEAPLCFITTVVEISARKLAEEELRETNEELTRFTYTVSHDLKSPLVTIKTFLSYVEQDIKSSDAERVAKDMGFIRNAADKMSLMLDELLALSRVGRRMNPSVETPLSEVVKEALDLVAGQITSRGVKIKVTDEPVILFGDRPRLVEVFQNLVDNAVKFMGDQLEPLIEIGVEDQGTGIKLFVRDNGMGIEPRYQPKLFGLFEKLDPASKGTGIGLSLVRRIVEVHGGKIWLESEGLGKGTTFRFTLAGLKKSPEPPGERGEENERKPLEGGVNNV